MQKQTCTWGPKVILNLLSANLGWLALTSWNFSKKNLAVFAWGFFSITLPCHVKMVQEQRISLSRLDWNQWIETLEEESGFNVRKAWNHLDKREIVCHSKGFDWTVSCSYFFTKTSRLKLYKVERRDTLPFDFWVGRWNDQLIFATLRVSNFPYLKLTKAVAV